MAGANSTYTFLIKTLGAEEGAAQFALIEKAAARAGKSVEAFLRTSAGSNLATTLKNSASAMALASTEANKLAAAENKTTASANSASNAHTRLAGATRRGYIAQTALTTVLSASINKAFLEMVDVTGQAIQRVDLLAQFPAAMSALGLSAADASLSLQKLSQYVGEIGGNLQDATATVARFAEVTHNVKAATAEFVGVNNALIAGGAGAEVQKNAMEQLIQAYSRGKPQLIEWRSLLVAMPAQLNQVATAMGFVNAGALGDSLTAGKTSMQDFMTKLTQMSTGVGPIMTQAEARMNGIQFAFNRFKNTMVAGMTEVIQTIGRSNIIAFFNLWTGAVRQLTIWAVKLVGFLFSLFNMISRIFGGPQLKLAADNTSAIADNIGGAADGAGDLADGLGDAGKAAKKTAGQLAAFDKMNVLTDPTANDSAGKDKGGSGGPAGLNTADAGALEGIFDGIGGKLGEITTGAKILAGILAGIAAVKFAQGVFNQLNGLVKTFKETRDNIQAVNDKLKNMTDAFKKAADSLKSGFDKSFNAKQGEDVGSKLGNGIASGIGGVIGGMATRLWPLFLAVLEPIVVGVAGLFLGIAGFLGLPVEAVVAIFVVAIAAIVALVWVIWKNWDKIWGWMKDAAANTWKFITDSAKTVGDGIKTAWNAVGKFFTDIWNGVVTAATNAFNAVKTAVTNFFTAVAANPVIQVFADIFKFLFDIIMAIGQIAFVLFMDGVLLVGAAIAQLGAWFGDLWNGIVAIFSAVGQWFAARFKEAWDGIVAIWTGVVKWFTDVWNGIVAVFIAVGQWFGDRFKEAWDAIVAIFTPLINWFTVNVWTPLVNLFTPVITFFGNIFSGAWNAIMNVWRAVSGWFGGVWNGITAVFSNVVGFFSSIFNGAWNAIQTAFGNVRSFLSGLWDGIASGLRGALQTAINLIYSGMNKVGDFVNTVISSINDLSSKVNGPQISFKMQRFNPPQLARGGVVSQSTLVNVGEAGSEAIVPLENNLEWIDKLAAKINSASGGGGQPIQLTVQIGEDKIATKVIDLINEKTQMSGRNAILV